MSKQPQLSFSIPDYHRAHRSAFSRWLGRKILALAGWQITGAIPDARKLVVAVGPHTSNWDFIVAMAALLALDLRAHWLAKHSLFRPPLKGLLIALGGLPVNRTQPAGVAESVAERIRAADAMVIALTPEGTRSKVNQLKTGFVRIARATPCAILPVTLDFAKRQIHLHDPLYAGENLEEEAARVREIFATATPRHAHNF